MLFSHLPFSLLLLVFSTLCASDASGTMSPDSWLPERFIELSLKIAKLQNKISRWIDEADVAGYNMGVFKDVLCVHQENSAKSYENNLKDSENSDLVKIILEEMKIEGAFLIANQLAYEAKIEQLQLSIEEAKRLIVVYSEATYRFEETFKTQEHAEKIDGFGYAPNEEAVLSLPDIDRLEKYLNGLEVPRKRTIKFSTTIHDLENNLSNIYLVGPILHVSIVLGEESRCVFTSNVITEDGLGYSNLSIELPDLEPFATEGTATKISLNLRGHRLLRAHIALAFRTASDHGHRLLLVDLTQTDTLHPLLLSTLLHHYADLYASSCIRKIVLMVR